MIKKNRIPNEDGWNLIWPSMTAFEQLLEDSAGGSGLSLEIKQAEMATSDLLARVHVSDLKAKDSLASSLSEFIDDAKKTARSLQKLTSKVGGAVDK